MTYITRLAGRKAMPLLHILTLVLASCLLLTLHSSTVNAQWATNGNNINNTNTGNVGIGTSNPSVKLEVNGTVKSSGGLTITGAPAEPANVNALYIGMSGTTAIIDAVDQMVDFRDLVISDKTFRVNSWNGGALVTGLFQNTVGNVGIGTTTPGYLLDVAAPNQWVARFRKTDATNGGVIIDSASGYNPNLALSVNGAFKWYLNNNSSNGDTLQFWESTGTNPRFTLTQSGNVGIGTTSPGAKLHVNAGGTSAILLGADTEAPSYNVVSLNGSVTDTGHLGLAGGGGTDKTLYVDTPTGGAINFRVNVSSKVIIDPSGNLGIGTMTPSKKLDVVGDINATGTITGGNIVAKYQDVAEWVESSQALTAGTVVVLDQTKCNQVIASSQAYDTRVAGVISSQPGITLGENGAGKVLVATTGRVRIKVDASRGSIQVGDLLVTSDVAGVAMKSQPIKVGGVEIHRPGTLIGKALEPLAKGTGEILVLLSLQ